MGAFDDSQRDLTSTAIALVAAVALLSSTLLAAGAHEHLGPAGPDVVCAVDHDGEPTPVASSIHGAARPHRHHCASCQLAAKSTAERPQSGALLDRPSASAGPTPRALTAEHATRDTAVGPRGPPIS